MKQQDFLEGAYYDRSVDIKCIKIKQPIGEFYIGCINSKSLKEITFSDVRRMEGERGFESYLGIQRPLSPSRVKEISQYTKTVDACFPTAVLLSVKAKCAEFNEENGVLTLSPYKSDDDETPSIPITHLANVIDGQHRIAGLHDYDGEDFEINVSIFVDIDVSTEAYIFSTVNLAQTKVNKSLVYDLYELATTRSPQKLCHEIAVALDKDEESPFFNRIKRLGSAQSHNLPGSITQAAFVQALMKFISDNPMRDRDTYLRGKIPALNDGDLNKLIFRKFLIKEKDYDLTDILWDYFEAVRARWPAAWASKDKGIILSKTNGFMAFMRFLRDAYCCINKEKPEISDFKEIFDRMGFDDYYFNTDNFKPGTSGESALYKELVGSGALKF
ncbi:DGQHR domain-containing protein [Stutzerimonas kunmingensis]|uniref:DGQHR domain-containing protein n=1 Tax=Stutzerimonas kunmingensis TaxID=1211807 RepID=UPI00241C998A|nr:DGQHR domain-containing protein [Stutzerimonas kunmingensis]